MRLARFIFNRNTLWRWLLGLGLLVGLVVLVQQTVGWGRLLSPWRAFPPHLLALLLLFTAISYLLRAIRIYDYSYHLLQGRFLPTLRLSVLHNTLNNFLPMRTGELAYPVLMKRYFGQDYSASGVTLVWIRVLDLHFLVFLGLLCLAQSEHYRAWSWLALPWLALAPFMYWGHSALRGRLAGRNGRLAGLLTRLLQHVPDSGLRFARIWLWTGLSWGFKFTAMIAVVLYFADIGLWRAVFGTIGAELSSVLPIHGLAGAGSYELAMAAVLLPLGLDTNTVLNAAVNMHLYALGANLLLWMAVLLLPRSQTAVRIAVLNRMADRASAGN
jgi:uncharacterized membrane protein YbhN (UPF0104 family)